MLCGTAGSDGRAVKCNAGEEGGEGGSLATYRLVFILGQLLHGLGAAPLITLGTTFLDESVSKRSSPLYIAVFQTWYYNIVFTNSSLLLKVCDWPCNWLRHGRFSLVSSHRSGEDMNSDMSSFITCIFQVSSPGLTPASSLWVGAWWPGFLLTFAASILCALVLQCFPASINRKRDTTLVNKEKEGKLKPLPAAIWALVTNPTYIFVSTISSDTINEFYFVFDRCPWLVALTGLSSLVFPPSCPSSSSSNIRSQMEWLPS